MTPVKPMAKADRDATERLRDGGHAT